MLLDICAVAFLLFAWGVCTEYIRCLTVCPRCRSSDTDASRMLWKSIIDGRVTSDEKKAVVQNKAPVFDDLMMRVAELQGC